MTGSHASPIEVRKGKYNGLRGTYWVWPFDGTFDVHFVIDGDEGPDGTDVISEWHYTIDEALEYINDQIAQSRIDEMFNV